MITLYGVTEDGTSVPVQVTDDGKLIVHKDESFQPGADIEVGSITASGTITAPTVKASKIQSGGDPNDGVEVGTKLLNSGIIQATRANGESAIFTGYTKGTTAPTLRIDADGSITAAGSITTTAAGTIYSDGPITAKSTISSNSYVHSDRNSSNETAFYGTVQGVEKLNITAGGSITTSGSIVAVDEKAGFTSAGELFFTSRNTRYRCVVQGQLMVPEEYTRATELREKAEKLRQPKTQDIVPED